ncbi:MAG: 50S ribosomal protein L23 [Flavobacteriales bacterium]|jgi:large subunit ribosomal protein L23
MKQILIRPLVTEKMSAITDKQGKYGFIVNRDANKIEIKHAVEKSYGVTVMKVNTINVDGKRKFRYTAKGIIEGRSQSYKKAIIKLQAGETIDFYANV